ncbi:uncharacterized protein LOC116174161 [Photinus pyralis]|uniref:uncharacterized protein LOC116174161 n=1 Tax=Photinus pyralis TaxID=7054 RepID=UPI001266EFFF|nr:uncharacterized protein LOC116174161 [Photinus pyralis]
MKFVAVCLALYLMLSPSLTGAEDLDPDAESKLPKEVIKSWENLMVPNMEHCIAESGIDPKRVPDIFGKMDMSIAHLDCFTKCHYEKLGFMDSDHKFLPKLMAEKISGLTEDIAKHCTRKYENEENVCDKVLSVVKCNINNIAKKYK